MLSKLLVLPPLSSPLWHKFILTKCMNMQRLLGIHAWKMGFLNPAHYSYFKLNIVVEKSVRCLILCKKIEENCQCYTVFENHRKSLIQHCERSELRLHFEWTKVN